MKRPAPRTSASSSTRGSDLLRAGMVTVIGCFLGLAGRYARVGRVRFIAVGAGRGSIAAHHWRIVMGNAKAEDEANDKMAAANAASEPRERAGMANNTQKIGWIGLG